MEGDEGDKCDGQELCRTDTLLEEAAKSSECDDEAIVTEEAKDFLSPTEDEQPQEGGRKRKSSSLSEESGECTDEGDSSPKKLARSSVSPMENEGSTQASPDNPQTVAEVLSQPKNQMEGESSIQTFNPNGSNAGPGGNPVEVLPANGGSSVCSNGSKPDQYKSVPAEEIANLNSRLDRVIKENSELMKKWSESQAKIRDMGRVQKELGADLMEKCLQFESLQNNLQIGVGDEVGDGDVARD